MPAPARHLALALFLPLLLAGAEPPSQPGQAQTVDPLEAARRDLKALPSLDRAARTQPALDDVAIPLPELRATAPSAPHSSPSAATPETKPSSQGWLLDALESGNGRDRGRDRGAILPDSTRRAAAAANPLENYLDQWISPQNRGILEQLTPERGREKEFRPRFDASWERRKTETRNGFQVAPVKPGTLLDGRRPANPYLEPSSEDVWQSEPSKPAAPAPVVRTAPDPIQSALPLSPDAKQPDFPSLKAPREAERYVSPTAPLVDENKYFPQLRKF